MDVYGLQILDATLEAGNTAEEEDTAASALLLKHEFLDGGADDVTLATLGEVLGGLRHDPERLRLEHCAHLHPGAGRAGVRLQNNDPWICLQFGSRLHFKRANLCRAKKIKKKRKQGVPKKGVPKKKGKGVSFGKA